MRRLDHVQPCTKKYALVICTKVLIVTMPKGSLIDSNNLCQFLFQIMADNGPDFDYLKNLVAVGKTNEQIALCIVRDFGIHLRYINFHIY